MLKDELEKKSYKTYENDEIHVFWNPELCQHAQHCIKGNGDVFNVSNRPQVDVSKAEVSEITEIIDRCPSGALKYELKSQIRIEFERNHNSSRAYDGDKLIGDCHFAELKGIWTISRTDVELGYEGRGIGKKLIQNVVDHARQENLKIVPMCPYAKKVMLNNPEYADIIY